MADNDDDNKKEEVEEEQEEIEIEVKDNTLKYVLILVAGIAIGLIVYKLFKDKGRKPEYHYMPYQGQVIHDNVEYHDLTKGQNIPQYRVPTTQNTVKNPLADIVNSQKPEDAPMIVNGIKMNRKGEMIIDKHPCIYERVIIKRDSVTGEVLDIITTEKSSY